MAQDYHSKSHFATLATITKRHCPLAWHHLWYKFPNRNPIASLHEKRPDRMAKQNFEEALARLEEITRQLEDGELSLEASLRIFDEGIKLADFCAKKLDEAQKKVDLLLKKNGELVPTPFLQPDGPAEAR